MQCADNLTALTLDSLKTLRWLSAMFKLQFTEDRLHVELLTTTLHHCVLLLCCFMQVIQTGTSGKTYSQVFRRKRNTQSV